MTDWSQLPPELLHSISKCLTLNADYVRFRAVCVSWRASTSSQKPRHLPPQFPWLMLPQGDSNTRRFLDLSSNKIHLLDLPETRDRWCCGSSHGWLVVTHTDFTICLINPLTKAQIPLPPLTTFPHVVGFNPSRVGAECAVRSDLGFVYDMSSETMRDYFIKKAILSASPGLTDDFVVMAILQTSKWLAFCRPGDEKWTHVYPNCPNVDSMFEVYTDIAYFDEQCYLINEDGKVFTCTVGPSAELTLVWSIMFIKYGCKGYFVESDGELLLVARDLYQIDSDIASYQTGEFTVFKLNLSGQWKLVQLKDIGDNMLFVGGNHSFSLRASDFPGCKGNCVYFTDDNPNVYWYLEDESRGYDFGLFNLHDKSIEWLQKYLNYKSLSIWPPPIWITPSLCW